MMINEDMIRRSDVLKWLDGRIKECEETGITTSIALNAEITTLRDVREFIDRLISTRQEEAV
jgi:hypothetical protein